MLEAMNVLEQSWSALPDITVANRWQSQQDSALDTDDPFAQLTEILDELWVLDHELVPDGLS